MFKLSKWFGSPSTAHLVDGGRVYCPVEARDVDVEHCMLCPFLEEVGETGTISRIVCRPTMRALTSADTY